MNKIFVSCGQFTDAEKSLGKAMVRVVKSVTGVDAFFAEQGQDLNGLDSNILGALRDCAAFITVLHPRGKIVRPDGSTQVRASVWIEQEIAIATYIQRVGKRSLPVIAFIHRSVGREGIRDLLHLNPIPFADEAEILAALPELLEPWKTLPSSGIRLKLESGSRTREQDHWIRKLSVSLVNDSSQRITSFNCQVRLPAGILKHWSAMYPSEVKSDDQRYRCFSFDESFKRTAISPHTTVELINFSYCTACAGDHTGEIPAIAAALVEESEVEAKIWIDGREYKAVNTIKGLSADAEARGV
ncbi:MAG: hypothetical protein WB249_05435 [Candidatus Sulfotelmatobacter sp.]